MEIIAIIIIGIIALYIQVTYERRRTVTNLEFQQKRLAAEAKNWADILEKATITTERTASAMIAKSVAAASNNRWRDGEADRLRNISEAERLRHDLTMMGNKWPFPGTKPTKPAPVGVFGSDGIYREGGQMVAMYDVMTDSWKDRSGQTIPDPRQNASMQAKASRFTGSAPSVSGWDPYESELEAQARRASQSAMMDAIATGTGMVRVSSEGVEHVPAEKFQGGGGSFDGGGASGDYSRSETCSSASTDTSSSDSTSCSSSDSGASSSPSD